MRITSRLVLVLWLVSAIPAGAQTTLSWDPSTSAGVTGYLVSYGPQSGFYTNTVDVGNQTSWTITGLDPSVDLFFAVRAYTSAGSISAYSNETELPAAVPSPGTTVLNSLLSSVSYPILPGQGVTWTASATSSAGPVEYAFWMFSQSAGWVKVQDYSPAAFFTWTPASGDLGTHWLEVWARTAGSSSTYETWMATGLFDVGTSTAVDSFTDSGSTSSSTSSSSSSSSSAGGCTTTDPFATIGGGSCVNGGWLPPGMTGASPSPTTPPSTTTSTTTVSAGCTTPDPFASMGGGACVNGGWLPPGMTGSTTSSTSTTTAPNGTSAGSGTTSSGPPSSTTTSPFTGGCTISDPFVSIGGGTCINGGWVPGHISTGSTTSASGTTTGNTSGSTASNTSTSTNQQPTFGGCTIPDPFVSIGGGICINGGWVPKG